MKERVEKGRSREGERRRAARRRGRGGRGGGEEREGEGERERGRGEREGERVEEALQGRLARSLSYQRTAFRQPQTCSYCALMIATPGCSAPELMFSGPEADILC